MRNRKWLSIFISIVISLSLWVYVVLVENPDDETTITNIPVTFYGEDLLREDYSLLITDSNADSGLTMTFFGKLSDLTDAWSRRALFPRLDGSFAVVIG